MGFGYRQFRRLNRRRGCAPGCSAYTLSVVPNPTGYDRKQLGRAMNILCKVEDDDVAGFDALARRRKTTRSALIRTAIRRFLGRRIERGPLVLFIAVVAATSCVEDVGDVENVEDVENLALALNTTEAKAATLLAQAVWRYDCVPVADAMDDIRPANSLAWLVVDSIRAAFKMRVVLRIAEAFPGTVSPPEMSWTGLNEFSTRRDSIRILRAGRRMVRDMERAKCDDWPDELP